MESERIQLTTKQAYAYIIPLGKFNLVTVVTDTGMVGCGAFDTAVLDTLGYPAARVKGTDGKMIANVNDLLAGEVKDANNAAAQRGIKAGMSGRHALELL
jgi:uncharacterized protein YunC (DUF1805 family)